MSDWEMLLKVVSGVVIFLGGNALLLFRDSRRDALVQASYAKREGELLKLIKNLTNRIHAKDLSSYAMLQATDQKAAQPPSPVSEVLNYTGDDEIDARVEEMRKAIIERELNGAKMYAGPPEED